jgi:hypothetical protein
MEVPDGWTDSEIINGVQAMWVEQSLAPPAWVDGTDDHLTESVARVFRSDNHDCPVGQPKGWDDDASA